MIKPGALIRTKWSLMANELDLSYPEGTILMFLKKEKDSSMHINFWFLTLDGQKVSIPFSSSFKKTFFRSAIEEVKNVK